MNREATGSSTNDIAADARKARFGALPPRVAPADLVEEKPASPVRAAMSDYDPDGLGLRFSCLAADLGL
ncbi:hypothetical protein [Yinghuangia seranimata]|uniref:hypothetical protein n=1 Tax=Yinghuangia seranimata TaxID=408067 RepID=UPI00248ACC5C|nr:hypothetical protein [Yinghuangia seranimata]MDI2124710.1 hypothetical protein [Yinghuangia seranimata]